MAKAISQYQTRAGVVPATPTIQDSDLLDLAIAGVDDYKLTAVEFKTYVNTSPAISNPTISGTLAVTGVTITGQPTWSSAQTFPSVSTIGAVTSGTNLGAAATGEIFWSSRSSMKSSVDGIITLFNAALSGFTRLTFGGTSATEPALRRNGAGLDVVTADASAYAQLQVGVFIANGGATVANGLTVSSGTSSLQALTATTGTFSGTIVSTKLDGVTFQNTSNTTGTAQFSLTSTGASLGFGISRNDGTGLIAGASAYSAVFATGNVTDVHLGTNGIIRLTISSAGAFDFKSNSLSGVLTGTATNWIATGALQANAASRVALTHNGTALGTIYTFGNDASTNGSFAITSRRSDGTNSINIAQFDITTTTLSGALTVSGTVNGATSIAYSTVIQPSGTGSIFDRSGVTTAAVSARIANTSGSITWAVESSVAGATYSSSTAYASIIGSGTATSLEFITNTTVRMGIVGVAGTPTNSSVGNMYVKDGTAPTGNPTASTFSWGESGTRKGRGTSGTVTTYIPA